MKLDVLDEPDLEFHGGSRHPDPRHGITDYGPADAEADGPRVIRIATVGTSQGIDGLHRWLEHCRGGVSAKNSRLQRLFMPFPGFTSEVGYRAELVFDARLQRQIHDRDLARLSGLKPSEAVPAAVALYASEIENLDEEPDVDVILVARPDDLPERPANAIDPDKPWKKQRTPASENFRVRVKAECMRYRRPLQVIRRSTWDPTFKSPQEDKERGMQDEATRAWNLHTAIYYKAGGVPWRLPRDATDLATCYVGISFYRSSDNETLQTSVAQVFNQRGDGVIVRGGPVQVSKDDRQPHLSADDAQALLAQALSRYRAEHLNVPARIVLHKTSSYTEAEVAGFQQAADAVNLHTLELIWLPSHDPTRLFRLGENPPLRGTLLSLDSSRHLLYTRGSVPFYGVYPGMYIPSPLPFRPVVTESSVKTIAQEILALTKMNWNQTQLDARRPITLHTANHVGEILRYVPEDVRPHSRYATYM